MSKPRLTTKQRAFINAYLQCLNATEAARLAGYSQHSARQIGTENLSKPSILAIIEQRLAEQAMSANEVLARLSEQARGDLSDFMSIDDDGNVSIDLTKAEQAGLMRLIKKLSRRRDGTVTIELHDAQSALNTLAKYHGLLKDHIQIDVNLVTATVEALETLGQDPKAVFNEIIARAARARQHSQSQD